MSAVGFARSAALVAALATSAVAAPASHTVVIEGTRFSPEALTVARGDRVVWVNKDPFPHTATAAGTFDSKSIGPGASWTYRATKPGTFDYVCSFHPTMKATLTVR
jgi:plastocyanin